MTDKPIRGDAPAPTRSPKRGDISPSVGSPKRGGNVAEEYVTFSFKYWHEREWFGIGKVKVSWFSSLLDQLRNLSSKTFTQFQNEMKIGSGGIRYHEINWDLRNVPLRHQDLLPKHLQDNEKEFQIFQFSLSGDTGRVHGFWIRNCFHIVLLDPLHNLQPSKDVNYNLRHTKQSSCEYSSLRIAIDKATNAWCLREDCKLVKELNSLTAKSPTSEDFVIIAGLEPDVAQYLQELRDKKPTSISEIVFRGILSLDDKPPSPSS